MSRIDLTPLRALRLLFPILVISVLLTPLAYGAEPNSSRAARRAKIEQRLRERRERAGQKPLVQRDRRGRVVAAARNRRDAERTAGEMAGIQWQSLEAALGQDSASSASDEWNGRPIFWLRMLGDLTGET